MEDKREVVGVAMRIRHDLCDALAGVCNVRASRSEVTIEWFFSREFFRTKSEEIEHGERRT
jgi:hypothetical protein